MEEGFKGLKIGGITTMIFVIVGLIILWPFLQTINLFNKALSNLMNSAPASIPLPLILLGIILLYFVAIRRKR